jgi:steroid 5-alpha reductase family enzyme
LDTHIRKIFSVFVLGMIGLFVMRISAGEWTVLNWTMLIVANLCCLLVFRCFVWVFNFSYALVCILNGALIALLLPSIASLLLGGAMVIYGLRLFLFVWKRVRSESYRPRVDNIREEDQRLPFPVKIALWVQCTFMYTFHLFALYMVASLVVLNGWVFAAVAVILLGTFLEAFADEQKQDAKRQASKTFVTTGIYARWRHPNYMGEIIVQIGLMIAGIAAVGSGWANYAAVIIAPAYIILLMIAESVRVNKSQLQRYGDDERYQAYMIRSGSLLPRL